LSGARGARSRAAEAMVRLAEAEVDEARQVARVEAMELWVRCLAAQARVDLQRRRVETEGSSLRAAEVRLRSGAVGMGDVTLATVELALARGGLHTAEAERDAANETLRARMSLAPTVAVVLRGGLTEERVVDPLELLLRRLDRRADVRRATVAARASGDEADLQRRLGVPPLRVGVGGGRENEYYGRVGVDFALPVFQRNQTAVAVASAGVRVAEVEREVLRSQAEAELRIAYARWVGARRAWETLHAALPSADQAELFSTRAYELGHRELESTLVVLRQTHELRVAELNAAVEVAQALRAIDRAVGGP
jgi:cobalt-zinc-cadmium efflux system outer membrane protein